MLAVPRRGQGRERVIGRVLVLFIRLFGAATLITANTSNDTAADALRALMIAHGTFGPDCSTVLFADHTETALSIVQDLAAGYAEGGTTLLLLPDLSQSTGNTNTTVALHQHLRDLMKVGRMLRFIARCVTMVFITDSKPTLEAMLDHSTDDRLMDWSAHCVIVTGLSELTTLTTVESKWAFTMMNTLLLLLPKPAAGQRAQVFRHEPYSPEGPRTLRIGRYVSTKTLVITAPLHFDKFNDFFGTKVNFSALHYLPHIGIVETTLSNGTKQLQFSGRDYNSVMSFGKVLNFEPTYVDDLNSWRELEERMMDRKLLIVAAAYYILSDRLKDYDYLDPFYTSDLAFVMRQPDASLNWDNFMKPFLLDIWISVVVMLLLISLCFYLILKSTHLKLVKYSRIRGGKQSEGWDHQISKTRIIFEVYGSLIGQDFNIKMPHNHSFRIMTTVLFIYIIVLSTGYKSNLIAYMTARKEPFKIETVQQLVDSNVRITAPPWGKDHQKALRASPNVLRQILAERYTFVDTQETGFKRAKTYGSAYIDDRPSMTMKIAEKFTKADGSSDYYIGRESVASILVSLIIPHDAPYKKHFDTIMGRIFQGHLYIKWYHDVINDQKRKQAESRARNPDGTPIVISSEDPVVQPLTVGHLQGPFWILLCGMALSTVVFLVELSLTKWGKICRKNVSQ